MCWSNNIFNISCFRCPSVVIFPTHLLSFIFLKLQLYKCIYPFHMKYDLILSYTKMSVDIESSRQTLSVSVSEEQIFSKKYLFLKYIYKISKKSTNTSKWRLYFYKFEVMRTYCACTIEFLLCIAYKIIEILHTRIFFYRIVKKEEHFFE